MNNIALLYETKLFYWFNSLVFLDARVGEAIAFLSSYSVFIMLAALCGFAAVFIIPKYKHLFRLHAELVLFALVSGIFARFAVKNFITFFYSRPRPFEILPDIQQLLSMRNGEAFPSGHAIFFFAVAAAIMFYYPRISIVFFLGAFFFSVIRIIAGVHWPLDILVGAVLGILNSWVFYRLLIWWKKNNPA